MERQEEYGQKISDASPSAIQHEGIECESSRIHFGVDDRTDWNLPFISTFELRHHFEIHAEVQIQRQCVSRGGSTGPWYASDGNGGAGWHCGRQRAQKWTSPWSPVSGGGRDFEGRFPGAYIGPSCDFSGIQAGMPGFGKTYRLTSILRMS